jgi:glutathione peroxidase
MKPVTLILIAVIAAFALGQEKMKSFYDFTVEDIDGKPVKFSQFKGKTVLVVNVASKCGLTPQYAALQKLHDENKEKGLVVLGFPSNDFRGQEPGTNEEIKDFCSTTYGVTFPMFSKITVLGDQKHELYSWLLQNGPRKDEIEWNFAKFLIDRDGKVVKRFSPRTAPDAPEITEAIEKELARQ